MVTLRQQPDPSRGTDHPRPQPQRGGAARIPGGGVVTAEAEPADRIRRREKHVSPSREKGCFSRHC